VPVADAREAGPASALLCFLAVVPVSGGFRP
jgi:hypothetical protein